MKNATLVISLSAAALLTAAVLIASDLRSHNDRSTTTAGTILGDATLGTEDGQILARVSVTTLDGGNVLLAGAISGVNEFGLADLSTTFDVKAGSSSDELRIPLDGQALIATVDGGSWSDVGDSAHVVLEFQ